VLMSTVLFGLALVASVHGRTLERWEPDREYEASDYHTGALVCLIASMGASLVLQQCWSSDGQPRPDREIADEHTGC
jgi:hypothetical protein